jgi:hypothetical protein
MSNGPIFHFNSVIVALAALSGAITALAFTNWKEMSALQACLTLIAGFSFAVFVTPWIAESIFGIQAENIRAIAGLTYVFGSGSNVLLPKLIKWVSTFFGAGNTNNDG